MSALHQDEDDPRHSDVTFDEENELLVAAANLFDVEKLSDARNALRMIRDPRIFSERHHHINNVARECEESILELIGEPGTVESGWSKQGESHGKFDTTIYYKVDDESKLTCRLETPIESSLLVPLLSVMNESDLYLDWCPSWRVLNGNIGIRSSRRLERIGRVNQMLHVVADLTWPFSPREVFMQTVALDDIDTNGYFAVRLHSNNLTSQAPPLQSNMERINFEGILLFRPYPLDSVVVASGQVTAENEPKILVSFKM